MKKRFIVLSILNLAPLLAINASDINNGIHKIESKKNTPLSMHSDTLQFQFEDASLYSRVKTLDFTNSSDSLMQFINAYKIKIKRRPFKTYQVNMVDGFYENFKMSPLYMPLIFNSNRTTFHLTRQLENKLESEMRVPSMDSLQLLFESVHFMNQIAQKIIRSAETMNIANIKYDKKTLPPLGDLNKPIDGKSIFYKVDVSELMNVPKLDTKYFNSIRVNPWKTAGAGKFQISQTFVSPNWSKGGESNMAGLLSVYMQAIYSNSSNLLFENYLDLKIGLNTVSTDTLRNLNVSTDQIKLSSKFGLRMYNDWYYSLSAEFNTQVLNNYKSNTWSLKSAFLSPAKLFIGLGVDYKKNNPKKRTNLSVLVTPLTVKMNYLLDNVSLSPSSFGIDPGKHFGSELGSKITANLSWKFSEQLKWSTKFYYFTNFEYVDTDWENTFDVMLSNYFSTTIYVHFKLDDRLKRAPGESLLQTQELMSFGMMYRW